MDSLWNGSCIPLTNPKCAGNTCPRWFDKLKRLPSPVRGRETAASAVVDEVAKTQKKLGFLIRAAAYASSAGLRLTAFTQRGSRAKRGWLRGCKQLQKLKWNKGKQPLRRGGLTAPRHLPWLRGGRLLDCFPTWFMTILSKRTQHPQFSYTTIMTKRVGSHCQGELSAKQSEDDWGVASS